MMKEQKSLQLKNFAQVLFLLVLFWLFNKTEIIFEREKLGESNSRIFRNKKGLFLFAEWNKSLFSRTSNRGVKKTFNFQKNKHSNTFPFLMTMGKFVGNYNRFRQFKFCTKIKLMFVKLKSKVWTKIIFWKQAASNSVQKLRNFLAKYLTFWKRHLQTRNRLDNIFCTINKSIT
jgi:hypothetical protein